MSQLLDIRRCYLLFCKHWFENRKVYGLFFLTVLAFFIGWFAFLLMIGNPYAFRQANQSTLYFSGLFIAGCLSASFLFRDFSTKPRKINYLLLPAATLEKLLCVIFYGVVIFFIGYTLLFYITDYVAVNMANNTNAEMFAARTPRALEWKQRFEIMQPLPPVAAINVFSSNPDMYVFYPGDNVDLFSAFFPIQSAFILGSVYFSKNSFFKTVVVLLIIWLLFFIIEDKLLFPLLPKNVYLSKVFSAASIADGEGNEKIYSLPFWMGNTITFLMRFAITPLLWVATYYRMKEKEI